MVLGVRAVASPLGRSLPVPRWPRWHPLLEGKRCQMIIFSGGEGCSSGFISQAAWDSKQRSAGDLSRGCHQLWPPPPTPSLAAG